MRTMTKSKQAIQELKDLDVERVDGVDRPATGRAFLLFKSELRPASDEAAFANDRFWAELNRWGHESETPTEVKHVDVPGLALVAPEFTKLVPGARVLVSPMTPYFYEDIQPTEGDRRLRRIDDELLPPGEGGGVAAPGSFRPHVEGKPLQVGGATIRKRASLARGAMFRDVFRMGDCRDNGK